MISGRRPTSARLHRAAAMAASVAALGWTTASAGSIYVCRDPSGRAHTADRPIAECAHTPLRELRSDGSVRREIAAPPTPEQVRQREADEQRRLADEAARRERQRQDRALLMAYPTEARLAQQHARALDALRRDLDEALGRIAEQDGRMKALQARLGAAVGSRQPASPVLAQQLDQIAGAIRVDDALARGKRDEIARLEATFDADRQRLRQLLAAGRDAAPAQTATAR